MGTIRTMIVGGDQMTRMEIRQMTAKDPEVQVVGEYGSGMEAIGSIRAQRPELVFMDVQMSGLNGFDVLECINHGRMPVVVFLASKEEQTSQLLDAHAMEYLFKPVERTQFQTVLQRSKEHLRRFSTSELKKQFKSLVQDARSQERYIEKIIVRSGDRVTLLRAEELDWVEAAGNYMRVHRQGEAHLIRQTMNDMEGRLDPQRFLRIHRCTIVNMERIKSLQPIFHGDYAVHLHDGTQLTLTRNYRAKAAAALGHLL
jgi:two-component system LytT family response regulator